MAVALGPVRQNVRTKAHVRSVEPIEKISRARAEVINQEA
jgi:hypothetical protein